MDLGVWVKDLGKSHNIIIELDDEKFEVTFEKEKALEFINDAISQFEYIKKHLEGLK